MPPVFGCQAAINWATIQAMEWMIHGHEWAAQILQKHIAQNNVRHAYLLSGAPGIGRRSLAIRFAQAMNCLQPPAPGQPCGGVPLVQANRPHAAGRPDHHPKPG